MQTEPRRFRLRSVLGFRPLLGVVVVGMLLSAGLWQGSGDPLARAAGKLRRMGHPTSQQESAARWSVDPAAHRAAVALGQALVALSDLDRDVDPSDFVPVSGGGPGVWTPSVLAVASGVRSDSLEALAGVHLALQQPALHLSTNLVDGVGGHTPGIFAFIRAARVLTFVSGWEFAQDPPLAASGVERLVDGFALARLQAETPMVVTAIGALAAGRITLGGLETALGRARLSEPQLVALQAAVWRIDSMRFMEDVLVSELFSGMATAAVARTNPAVLGTVRWPLLDPFLPLLSRLYSVAGFRRSDLASYVDLMVSQIEAARAPPDERGRRMSVIHSNAMAEVARHPWKRVFSGRMMPRLASLSHAALDMECRSRAAWTALGIERYRLRNGDRLPCDLAELVPEFLDHVPADPFGEGSLRYRRLEGGGGGGYVVYSVGGDQRDDAGAEVPVGDPPDIGFRVVGGGG